MMRSPLLAITLVSAFGAFVPRVARAEAKLAFVDLQRALEETDDGKKAKARLKSDFDKKQKELNEKQDELQKMKEEFDKKATMMKPDAQQAEAKKLQERFVQLQEIYQRLQQDLAKKEQEATGGILRKLQMVTGQIAEKQGFNMVLEKNSAVVWGQTSLDITNEVIRSYNAQASASTGGKTK